ncbi:MAG: endonuclease/exonuclease/phosphatase family protein [Bacteroidetes bacterium]|nr:endonuclease/exonuclease/phosphatase family protein [Bacteroidota bacterium]
MRKFINKILFWLNILSIIFLLLSYLSSYISPEDNLVFPLFGLLYQYILLVNILFVVYWIFRKKLFFLLSLITILIGWNFFNNFFQFRFPEKSTTNQTLNVNTFKLLSYNVRLFDLYNWSHNKDTKNKMFDYIKSQDAEILCFQEFYNDETNSFSTLDTLVKFQKAKNYHHAYTFDVQGVYHFGIATFSSYPIVGKGEIRFKNTNNICIYTDIKIKNDTIRIYNNHLQSIHLQKEDYNFIDNINSEKDKIKGAEGIVKRLQKAYKERAYQSEIISNNIKQSPYPVIVCGDFNDNEGSYVYRKMRNDLNDAFVNCGSGFGNTYNRKITGFRIDYILYDDFFKASNFKISKIKYSDHYPLQCRFEISE